jgi:hypothetical protein
MSNIGLRVLQLAVVLTIMVGAAYANPPYTLCNSHVGLACVTPFLDSHNSGDTTGEPNYPVQVTPNGGTESTINTNGNDGSQGYIVLIGPVGTSWLIAPNPTPRSWAPSFQNVTDNIPYDPNSPGTTVLVPVFTCNPGSCHS